LVAIDLIGLCITILAIGIRYPHYGLITVFVHEIGRMLMALVISGRIDAIISAGAFGSATFINQSDWSVTVLFALSGPLANYVFCAASGGIDQEKLRNIFNPAAKLRNPFAVLNLRFAVLSFIASSWHFL
jgi:hypothetical protein